MERAGLSDPFSAAFYKAVGVGKQEENAVLSTEKQWRGFVTALDEAGLLSEPEAMEDIWAELVSLQEQSHNNI